MAIPAILVGMASSIRIIGLNSPAPQSGKSTVAQALAERNGGLVLSIAGGIRDMARSIGLASAADAEGAAKDLPHPDLGERTPREVLIAIGNSMRSLHGEDYWVRQLLRKIRALPANTGLVVIDDVRTQLEGDTVFMERGCVITIERTGVEPNPGDVGGFEPVVTVNNDGTVDECVTEVREIAETFFLAVEAA